MNVVGSLVSGLSIASSDVNLDAFIENVNGVSRECRLSRLPAEPNAPKSSFVDPYKKGFGSLLPEIYDLLKLQDCTTTAKDDSHLPPFPPIQK